MRRWLNATCNGCNVATTDPPRPAPHTRVAALQVLHIALRAIGNDWGTKVGTIGNEGGNDWEGKWERLGRKVGMTDVCPYVLLFVRSCRASGQNVLPLHRDSVNNEQLTMNNVLLTAKNLKAWVLRTNTKNKYDYEQRNKTRHLAMDHQPHRIGTDCTRGCIGYHFLHQLMQVVDKGKRPLFQPGREPPPQTRIGGTFNF